MGFPLERRPRNTGLAVIVSNGWRESKPANRPNGAGRRAGYAWPIFHPAGWAKPLLLLGDFRRGRRPFSHDQEHGVLVLGAVPVHLLAVMGDEAAGGHRNRALLRIEFRSRTDPPRSLQHHDVAVIGVEVRAAEMVALGPLVVDHVEAGLGGIADHHRLLRAARADRTPWNLIGKLVDQ